MSVSIFLPVRKGSERIFEKNTRRFCGKEGGLLELKLEQLLKIPGVNEVLVSTNDEKCQKIAEEFQKRSDRLFIIKRPDVLGNSTTDLFDLIKHAGEISNSDHILWTHVTSPFFDSNNYKIAIDTFTTNLGLKYDSLVSGRLFKNFLLDKRTHNILNNSTGLAWPRTQDLNPLFEINNAVFLASRNLFLQGKRIGENPYYMESGKIESLDIDDIEEFHLAEAWYDRNIK